MNELVAEIWLCLVVSAILGLVAGWLIWGRSTESIITDYRWRLATVRKNWETVEDQLVESLSRIAELERALGDRQREHGLRETGLRSLLQESEEAWKKERRSMEATVSGLDEHLRSLEAAARIQNPIDVPTAAVSPRLAARPDSDDP